MIAAARLEGAVQQAIHTYKYRPRPALGGALAGPLVEAVRQSRLRLTGLAFVPLHPERARQRGFIQAERLATELSACLSLPLIAGLERVRPTRAQVGLSGSEREANVSGAFRWVAAGPAPSGLGLVDDVCTTGATLRAAAAALEAAGGCVSAFLVLAVPHTLATPLVTLPE